MIFEPLRDRKQKMEKNIKKTINNEDQDEKNYYNGFNKGISDSFEVFDSTIEAYKRYKDNVKLLMKEQQKVWSKWISYYNGKSDINNSNFIEKYNSWLFDYVFSDINNEKSNDFFNI